MKLPGAGQQAVRAFLYDASGSITTGGTAQLVLARSETRSYLLLQNTSSGTLYFEFGAARAKATVTNGSVASVAVTNAGFGYTYPPLITMLGGGNAGNTAYLGLGQPNGQSPGNVASAYAVMTGTAPNQSVSSIVVNNAGSNYATAPYVFLQNDPKDPNGAALPSATVGIALQAASSIVFESTVTPTDQVSVYGATTGQTYVCKWSD